MAEAGAEPFGAAPGGPGNSPFRRAPMSGLPRESKRGRRAERSMFDLRAAGPFEIAGRAEPEIYHLPIGTGKGAGGKGQKKGV